MLRLIAANHVGRRKWLLTTAGVLAGVLALGTPQPARASLMLALSEDGGVPVIETSVADFTSGSFTGTFGDFSVSVFGASSNNGAVQSSLLSSSVSVVNNSGATHTLHLFSTQVNYTLPGNPPLTLNVESGLGGSLNLGTLGLTGIFQAWADKNNNLFGSTDFTNGLQNATAQGSTFDTGSKTGQFTRLSTPFSVTSVVNFTLSGGGQANFSDHVNLNTVPEPSAAMLVVTGAGLLGMGMLFRRRSDRS